MSQNTLRASSQSPVIDVALAVSAVELSLAEVVVTFASTVDTPVSVATGQESPAVGNSDVVSHVESIFQSFAKSLEAKFSAIDERFSQVMSSSASNDDSNRPNVSSQDVANSFPPAPSPVAMRYEHPPAQTSYAPYSDGLGMFREEPAAVRSPAGVSSLP